MKVALLCLTIALATLRCGAGYAQTVGDAKFHQESKTPVRQAGKITPTKKPTHDSIPLPKPASHQRTANSRKGSAAGNTAKAHPQVLDRPNGSQNNGLRQTSALDRARSVPSSAASRSASSTASSLRHHGPNPAILGGPRSASVASTATLNGNEMSRRP